MEEVLVADSFRARSRDGATEARGFSRHLSRFRASVADVFGTALDDAWWERVFDPFEREAVARIARGGAGFPRLEARATRGGAAPAGAPELAVRIRPLPSLGSTIALRTAALDLTLARVKGPNIARLAEVNRGLGAEALLVDASGRMREGATTSLVWWTGETLCVVRSSNRVTSVTERLLWEAAERMGVETRACDATVRELVDCEMWAVNALHGIRVVVAIDTTVLSDAHTARLDRFRDALDRTWETVGDAGTASENSEPAPIDT